MNVKKFLIEYTDWHDRTIYINQQEREKYLSKEDVPDKPCTTEEIVDEFLTKNISETMNEMLEQVRKRWEKQKIYGNRT